MFTWNSIGKLWGDIGKFPSWGDLEFWGDLLNSGGAWIAGGNNVPAQVLLGNPLTDRYFS